MKAFASIILALWAGSALSTGLPPRVALSYDLSKDGLVFAQAEESLERDGKSYVISSEAKATGLLALINRGSIRRVSRGDVTPQGLRPREFRDERTGRSPVVARFDWGAKTLVLEDGGNQEKLVLAPDTQDRLSFAYGFAFNPPRGKEIDATVTDGKHVSAYRYQVKGMETVTTPLGKVEALHLVKQQDKGDHRGAEIWLAPRYHYLPVRILVVEPDGSRLDQVAKQISYGDKK